jgi:hypothetical protein
MLCLLFTGNAFHIILKINSDYISKQVWSSGTGRILMKFRHSLLCASPLPGHRRPLSAREFCWWLSMLITFGMKGSSYLCSQITGGFDNDVPLHVDIPRTGGRGSDLPSEESLQQYLKFLYECFLSVLLPFECYCWPLCHLNFSSVSTRRLCFVFLYIKGPVVLSLFTKLWIVRLLGILS